MYTWMQGKISTSTGVVDLTYTKGIITNLNPIPLGTYAITLPYENVQFKKVTNNTETDVLPT